MKTYIPVIAGGIVPNQDIALFQELGIAVVLGPGPPASEAVETIRKAALFT
jgi:methylmalonyl-CoA mutase cobalamin-binding domain/chain